MGSFFVATGWFAFVYLLFILVYKNDLHEVAERYDEKPDLFEGNYDLYN
jgi:hypothetical protein